MKERVYVALDMTPIVDATHWASVFAPRVGGLKLGLQFLHGLGPTWVERMAGYDLPIFIDAKLHDTPDTVADAVYEICQRGASIISVHASGGSRMMGAAAEAARRAGTGTRIVGVTVLTSLDEDDLVDIGQSGPVTTQVLALAALAHQSGLDGVVCSPLEVAAVRDFLGPDFLLVTPGIYPTWAEPPETQKRTMTPNLAITMGADILVVGRAITAADRPDLAAERLVAELELI